MSACKELTPNQISSLETAKVLLSYAEVMEPIKVPGDGIFQFDMGTVLKETDCGTAGCILGLVIKIEEAQGRSNTWALEEITCSLLEDDHPAQHLFFPDAGHTGHLSFADVTPHMAAHAIEEFLAGVDKPFFNPG